MRKLLLLLLLVLSLPVPTLQAQTPRPDLPRIDLSDSRRFVKDGPFVANKPWYPIGVSPSLGAFVRRCDGVPLTTYYPAFHQWLVDHGIRSYRAVFTFGQQFQGRNAVPAEGLPPCPKNAGDQSLPYVAVDTVNGFVRYDLTKFDQTHFNNWIAILGDARAKGIVVQLVIMDAWHLNRDVHDPTRGGGGWGRKWDFYAPENNVNGVDFDPGRISPNHRPARWHDVSGPAFPHQKALVQEVNRQLGDFPNVIFEICNEPDAGSEAWLNALAAELKKGHLVMPRDLPEHRESVSTRNHEAGALHTELVRQFTASDPAPLIAHNDCDCFADTHGEIRARGWAALTAGAHIDYLNKTESFGDFGATTLPSLGARDLGYIGKFLDELDVDLRGMEPADTSLVPAVPGGSWAYARFHEENTGDPPRIEEAVVYKRFLADPAGNTHVVVKNLPRNFIAFWFNPRTGFKQTLPATSTAANGGRQFTPPSTQSNDWALHILETAGIDVFVPPGLLPPVGWGELVLLDTASVSQLPQITTYDLCNSGGVTLTIHNPTAMVSGAGFTQIGPVPASAVAPGQCTTLTVRFSPSNPGTYTGTVSISSNAGGQNPFSFYLRGTATHDPEIRVQHAQTGNPVPDGGLWDFGTWRTSLLPTSRLFEICNDGTDPLTLNNPTSLVSGYGFYQIGTAPVSPVQPGTCTSFRVRYIVGHNGVFTGAVRIYNDDADENPFDIALRGTAVAYPEIRIEHAQTGNPVPDGGSWNFGTWNVANLPTSRLFRLCNDGIDPLILSNPTNLVSGYGFSQIGTAPTTPLQPGACTDFRVRFHVVSGGSYSGTVTLYSNDADENPYNISLSGTAVN